MLDIVRNKTICFWFGWHRCVEHFNLQHYSLLTSIWI